MWLYLFLIVLINKFDGGDLKQRDIKIGGLFDGMSDDQQDAFKYAIHDINQQRQFQSRVKLRGVRENIPRDDHLAMSASLCRLLKTSVIGIFGPSSSSTSSIVQSICDTMEIPHIEGRWDPHQKRQSYLLNLHPHPSILSRVFVDLVQAWNWKSFTILYETGPWLTRVAELLKMYDTKGYPVTIRQLDMEMEQKNYRPVLWRVKESGEANFVLACSIEALPEILKQAQQVGLMADYHQYIITNLDFHTIDIEPFRYSKTNITGVRLVDPSNEKLQNLSKSWSKYEERNGNSLAQGLTPSKMLVETALMYDAVQVFSNALKDFNVSSKIVAKSIDCEMGKDSWAHGYSLVNYLKMSSAIGLTGQIRFDNEGFRSDFLLDIVELDSVQLQKVGTWNSTKGLMITRDSKINSEIDESQLQNKTFIVLTALSDPYGMLKNTTLKLSGNDRFEGYGIDLIHELSLMLGFNYTFKLQEDNEYGSPNPSGEWNGMMRELMEDRADLAITDLTITSERSSVVDFTLPFMNLGITILYKKPVKESPSLFSFLLPFSSDVWYYLGGAYVGVSLLLFILGRISPAEWQNPYPCVDEPEVLHNQFSLRNSLWFTIGSLMQQGSEIAPIAISTRMIGSMWWFFTLIMVSSYTANLAASLTVESVISPINNAEDLANQDQITYGAKRGGSTLSFFKDATDPVYQKMYQYMMEHPDMLTSTNPEGITRVKTDNYAYLMESSTIEYQTERECDITQIGSLLDDKGYGIAMKKEKPYRSKLSEAILRLQEQGRLTALKNKWWKQKRGGGFCANQQGQDDEAEKLGMGNVGGVFAVLVLGCGAACVVTIGEMIWATFKKSIKDKVSFREELLMELKFFIKCHGNVKPVRNRHTPGTRSSRSSGQSGGTGDTGIPIHEKIIS